jgi:4-amino-4-deoxy-L-arabinose transferase-like glycosyltransferase
MRLKQSNKTYSLFFIGFFTLYIFSVLVHLSAMPLDGEEPRRALVSIEMLKSGNYILPTAFGWEYFNKPPVFNWILSFLIFLTGSVKEWVIRLPSLIFLLAWGFAHYAFTKKFFPKNIAILSALFLITNFELLFYALANGGEIDIFYSFLVYLQIMFLFYFHQKKEWLKLFLWSYFFCAIGFLTKGFPSLFFQGFTIIALCVFDRSIKILFRWQHLVGILIFCFLVGAYLYLYNFYSSPQRLIVNLLSECFQKSAVGEHSERLWKKVFLYPFSFFKILLPSGLLLLLLFKKHSYRLRADPLVQFSILFIIFNIWIYAFTGRPILRYVYMFVPFALNIIVYIFWKTNEEYPALINKIFKNAVYLFFILLVVILGLPFFITVPLTPVVVLSLLTIGFILFYIKTSINKVWAFCLGLVLVRMVYAVLLIPVQVKYKTINYRNVVADMLHANKGQNITYWSEPEVFDVGLDLKYWNWKFESVITTPRFTNHMIPYYWYYHSGMLMKYDTALLSGKTYFTTLPKLKGRDVSLVWSWYDKRWKTQLLLFQKK